MVEVWRVRLEEDFRETEYTVVCLSVCIRVGRDQVCAWEGKSGGEKREGGSGLGLSKIHHLVRYRVVCPPPEHLDKGRKIVAFDGYPPEPGVLETFTHSTACTGIRGPGFGIAGFSTFGLVTCIVPDSQPLTRMTWADIVACSNRNPDCCFISV